MSQVDEGLIHAWLEGQLGADDAERVARLVESDAAWSAAAAEARGLIAGATRILGALDHVPSVRRGGAAAVRSTGVRRPWVRARWIGIAAVAVLATGVGSLVLRTSPPVAVSARTDAAVSDLPKSTIDPQQAANSGGGASQAEQRATPQRLAPPNAAPATIAAVPSAGRGRRDTTLRSDSVVLASKEATERKTLAPPASGSIAALGGAGARPAELAANRADLRDEAAKSPAKPSGVDPRLAGCWLPIESSARTFVSESAERDVYVLRFIDPVVTDVLAAPRQAAASSPPSPAVRPAPASARLQNTTARAVSDTSFVAEWISGTRRTSISFTVRGDSLVGLQRLSAGDVSYVPYAFRAVRTNCPQ